MNNYITPAPITICNMTTIQNGIHSINNVISNNQSVIAEPLCDDFINDITKSTLGHPQPGRTVIGICNHGDGYIYID